MNPHSDRADAVLFVGLAAAVIVGFGVWSTGEVASLLSHGQWPAVAPAAVASILVRLPSTWARPAQAWPAPARRYLPAAPGWFVASGAITLAVLGGVATVAWQVARTVAGRWHRASGWGPSGGPARGRRRPLRSRGPHAGSAGGLGSALAPAGGFGSGWGMFGGPGPAPPSGGAHWAVGRDIGSLRVHRPGGDRMVLGRVGRHLVATEARHSVLVLGPTQSGKTTALAIPALLEWDGPVVATSVKDDLVAHTRGYRATLGRTWVFDPTAAVRAGRRSQWSPLAEASTWSGAQRVAQAMVDATPNQGGLSDGAFWYKASAKLLAPLLLAAERGGRPMAEVVRWTNGQAIDEVQMLLELAGETDALSALDAGRMRDERISSSVYTTLETVLAPYEDPIVAQSAEGCDIDPSGLLDGRNTLYLCGPAHEQARVQAVFNALVTAVVHAAVSRYERDGPLDPPLLLLLDEASNIAPLKDLDTLASTAAGMGIQLMTVCQDLAQLSARYGPERARTIANNHRGKVALSGIGDIGTLDTLSGLAGEAAVQERTFTHELREHRRSTSSSISYRRLLPADELRRVRPGEGLLIYGHLPPARLVLRPWYQDRELRRRVELIAPVSTGLAVAPAPSGPSLASPFMQAEPNRESA